MAPFILNVTCPPFVDATTKEPADLGKDDLNALLYIVVTLLFYSMGIIIGIITYLKREREDMAEDQVFDLYLSFKQEPFNMHKRERVQQMAVYLKQLEEAKLAREKIEAWNAEQTQNSGNGSGTNIPAYGTSLSFPGASGAAVDAEKGHGAGASALLCSLTLGVCEPLLAPDGAISKATASVTANHNIHPGWRFGSAKGKSRSQRHSVPSMNNVDSTGKGIMRENHRSCHEKRTGFMFPSRKKDNQPIIEMTDLKRFKFERNLSIHQDDSWSDEELDIDLFRSNEPFQMSSFPNNENVPAFKRAAYASEKRKNKVIMSDQMSSDKDSEIPDEVSSQPSIAERDDSQDLESVENEPCYVVITQNTLSKSDLSIHTSGKASGDKPKENRYVDINEPTVTLDLPTDTDKELLVKKHSLCEPLTLDKTLLRPFSDTAADAKKPKLVTNSLTNIPQDVTRMDGLSTHRSSISPRFDSWRKGGAKTVDIPDSKLLQSRNKNEKPLGRNRRGALLFAQKSLHHIENEEPKPGSARRVLGYQESTESYSSRTTDSTDANDSPLLTPAFDRGQGQIQVQGDSSNDLGKPTSSPYRARRHERRIPKLVRSKTVDSSKSPPL